MALTFDRETLEAVVEAHGPGGINCGPQMLGNYLIQQWAHLDYLDIIAAKALWRRQWENI
jgi:hypothetical protein